MAQTLGERDSEKLMGPTAVSLLELQAVELKLLQQGNYAGLLVKHVIQCIMKSWLGWGATLLRPAWRILNKRGLDKWKHLELGREGVTPVMEAQVSLFCHL